MNQKIQWHPAFCYAMRLELRDVKGLEYTDEYNLTSKPLQIDLMIVKKLEDVVIHNKIGKLFKKHNLIEYKSPVASLNINTFYKTIAYACLYKSSAKLSEAIGIDEITITIIRNAKPREMFKALSKEGFTITMEYEGVYYIHGNLFNTQVIVSSELNDTENKWIKSLKRNIPKTLYEGLCDDIQHKLSNQEKEMADNVMQVVSSANADAIQIWKEGDSIMCQALREIMKPEIDEAVSKATIKTSNDTAKRLIHMGLSDEDISTATELPIESVQLLRAGA